MEATQQTLPLPYEELGAGLNRDEMRSLLKNIGGKLGRQAVKVPIAQLAVRDGFNWRNKPEDLAEELWLYSDDYLGILSLAKGIIAKCGAPPLDVDMTAEGICYITDGFRRFHAIKRIIEDGVEEYCDGSPVNMVEVFVNPKGTTELDRMVSIFTTQENKKLKPMEIARGLLRIKQHYSLSHEEIGNLIGKSRQFVDGKIALASEPEIIQQAVESGKLTPTAATALIGAVTSETERVHIVEESINNNIPLTVSDAAGKRERKERAENNLQMDLPLDVSKEKEEAEFACNQSIGNADKIRKYLKGLPKQNAEDVERLLDFIIKDVSQAREFIKKASDKR